MRPPVTANDIDLRSLELEAMINLFINLGAQVRGSEGSLAGVVQYITIRSVWTHFLLYSIYLKVRTCVLLHLIYNLPVETL